MSNVANKRANIQKLALTALFTALVIVFQLLGQFIRFGTFQIALVLAPIIIGAALCGIKTGVWLGFVFGAVVLLNGDATLFLTWNVPGTIITVLVKGILCGLTAAVVYKLLEKHNKLVAAIVAAIACPIVNTGVFVLGCRIFFYNDIAKMALEGGFASPVALIFLGFVGGNFIFELITNLILAPTITTVLKAIKGLRL